MKTHPFLLFTCRLLAVVLGLIAGTAAHAQQMPQDNWQSYGLQFSSPTPGNSLSSIAIGTGGVYVGEVEGGSSWPTRILQFTEGGVFIQRFTTTFTDIVGITCDPAGNVYVLDGGASSVTKLDKNGAFISQWGSSGTNNGQFGAFAGDTTMIAADKNSQVYVFDRGNSRVQVFDANGNFLRTWGQQGSLPGQFQFWGGWVGAIFVSSNGLVYCFDGVASVFDINGSFLTSMTSYVFGGGLLSRSISVTCDGLVSVIGSSGWGLVNVIFDPGHMFSQILSIPVSNFGPNMGSAFSKRGDLFYVLDSQVVVYQRQYASVQNSLSPPAIPLPNVLDNAQRAGTSWMDIDYQVTDADNPMVGVTTGVLAFVNGGTTLNEAVVMNTFMENSGTNVGLNQPTGVPLHLTWNMAADWSVDYSQVQIEVLAKDSRNLLGFQWITVPASNGNPAIQVCSKSISDSALLDLWFYLLATHQPGISLSNGTITGNADPYNGVVLAITSGTYPNDASSTTAAGRTYLYNLLGVQAITPAQITQAQGGNYGFTSVDSNSVVKLP